MNQLLTVGLVAIKGVYGTSPWAGVLFVTMGLIFQGFVIAMFYEAYAVVSGHETISSITAGAIHDNTLSAIIIFSVLAFATGLLLAHFTNWSAN